MFKLASSIGFALALAELKQRIRVLIAQGILGAIGGVVFLVGFCFLLVALHLWLSAVLNPIASAAIIGIVLVVIAAILFLVARLKGRAGTRAPAPPRTASQDNFSGLGDLLGSPALRNQALVVGGLALILGFLAGRRPRRDDERD
jgi:hypothetical protein